MSKAGIGAYVKIEFKGKVKSKAGREYNDFEVFQDTSTEGVTVAPAKTETKAPVAAVDGFDDDDDLPF